MIMVNYELSIGVRTISGDVPLASILQTDCGQSNVIMVNYELSIGVRTISGDVPFAPMLQTDRGQSNVARS